MNKCIYCEKDGTSVTFTREHVIPEMLGIFDNNLTLIGCVCSECNTGLFGSLETRFKEDTDEGIHCQRVNFADSYQIRVRNKNYKMSTELNLGEAFFNETFPFLKFTNDTWQITFLPQIKIRGYAGEGYMIFLIEDIKKLPRDGRKFEKLKNILKGVQSTDVSIFTYGGDDPQNRELNEAIELVKELGVPYKPGTQKSVPPADKSSEPIRHGEISIEGRIESDTARVLAKIAFNYFAYCARKSGHEAILFHPNFSKIKSYILGNTDIPLKDIIIEQPTQVGIIVDEREEGNIRLVGHTVVFENMNGNIISKVSFMGRLVYTILIGITPDELNKLDFGNGHIFDPIHKKIYGLTKNETRRGSEEVLNFTLFNGA